MRVIGVIDLQGGHAVHARGGNRALYAPVLSIAGTPIEGDAVALARAYLAIGVPELYVADLDAIGGAAPQDHVVAQLGGVGAPLWIDAGVATPEAAARCLALGAARVIVGLETLDSWQSLGAVCDDAGRERVAFSLDLRDGTPLGLMGGLTPEAAAARAADARPGALIVLDVARVGRNIGPDVELLARIRRAAPGVPLVAAGGIRNRVDLDAVESAGCDAALVATALHTGALRLDHVRAVR